MSIFGAGEGAGAFAFGAEMAGGVAIVDGDDGAVAVGERPDFGELGDVAGNPSKHAVGDELEAGRTPSLAACFRLGFQLIHVAGGVAVALGFPPGAPPSMIEGVVEGASEDEWRPQGLAGVSKRPPLASKQAAKRMKIVLAEIAGRRRSLELAVEVEGATNEAHRGHAEAVPMNGF